MHKFENVLEKANTRPLKAFRLEYFKDVRNERYVSLFGNLGLLFRYAQFSI